MYYDQFFNDEYEALEYEESIYSSLVDYDSLSNYFEYFYDRNMVKKAESLSQNRLYCWPQKFRVYNIKLIYDNGKDRICFFLKNMENQKNLKKYSITIYKNEEYILSKNVILEKDNPIQVRLTTGTFEYATDERYNKYIDSLMGLIITDFFYDKKVNVTI